MPLVSIIVTYYKKKKYILKCLKSIFNQSYKNFEVILIFDDNDKNEYEYIKKLKKKFRKIIVYKNKKNLGAGESRNKGIKLSKGAYVAFLDSDDEWHKDKLKKQMKYMIKNSFSISHTSYQIVNASQKFLAKRTAKTLDHAMLLKSCDIGLSSVIMKRNLFNKNIKFANTKTKEDYVLWLNITKNGKKIYALDKTLLTWRKNENSLSSSTIRKLVDGFLVYHRYQKYNFLKSIYLLIILSLNFLKKNYL
tara:strand:- start:7698 stop:8444 length:747 start_codon:yes stop_codon:yes gene_type:complete